MEDSQSVDFRHQESPELRAFQEQKTRELLEAVGFVRGMVLDTVELPFSTAPEWQSVRSRLLKALGHRGLESRIRVIMGTASLDGGDQ